MDTTNGALSAVVIDSDPDLRGYLRSLLAGMGYQVHVAGTAAEGVRLTREHRPDLVTTELHLPPPPGDPGMDGLEAMRQIQTFSNAYILVIAASNDPVDLYMALATAADDYLVKPFSPPILRARIAALARRPRKLHPHGPAHHPDGA